MNTKERMKLAKKDRQRQNRIKQSRQIIQHRLCDLMAQDDTLSRREAMMLKRSLDRLSRSSEVPG